MIRVFVSDIDGCLSEPFQTFDRDRLATIAQIATTAHEGSVPVAPPVFSICTGRAFGYLEAYTQLLGLRGAVGFEAGSGLFDLETGHIDWHPDLTPEVEREIASVRAWMHDRISGWGLSVDHGKRSQAGVIGPDRSEILEFLPIVRDHVATNHPGLFVASTPVSIDVMSERLTKRRAMDRLSVAHGVELEEMAFMGDTDGDLGALSVVGRSYAPANAEPAVREAVQHVTTGAHTVGVLEAYTDCITWNRENR